MHNQRSPTRRLQVISDTGHELEQHWAPSASKLEEQIRILKAF